MVEQLETEQAILTKSTDFTYSDVFRRGPLIPIMVKVRLNLQSDNAAAVVYIQSSEDNSLYENCAKSTLSKASPYDAFVVYNTDEYMRAQIESVSGGSVDVLFDAVEA